MRGKEENAEIACKTPGITPAYAGKRIAAFRLVFFSRGSPPPMRGKVKEHFTGAYNARITPAYAGKRAGGHDEREQN